MLDKPLIALLGATGSGKTEIALQLALNASRAGHRTCLIDLDIVNPYFRSGSRKNVLESGGVNVIMPNYAMTAVDVPSLPGNVRAAMGAYERLYIDVGGDEAGAVAMGGYAEEFSGHGGVALFVVNTFRPMSGNEEDIIALIRRVEARARLKASGIINNANIGRLTTSAELAEGQRVLKEAAGHLALPIVAAVTSVPQDILPDGFEVPLFQLEPRLRPDWLNDA